MKTQKNQGAREPKKIKEYPTVKESFEIPDCDPAPEYKKSKKS